MGPSVTGECGVVGSLPFQGMRWRRSASVDHRPELVLDFFEMRPRRLHGDVELGGLFEADAERKSRKTASPRGVTRSPQGGRSRMTKCSNRITAYQAAVASSGRMVGVKRPPMSFGDQYPKTQRPATGTKSASRIPYLRAICGDQRSAPIGSQQAKRL
jgi:hypothetical protein